MPAKSLALALTVISLSALCLSAQAPPAKPMTPGASGTPRTEKVIIWLPDASLTYEPGRRSFEIRAAGAALSRGQGWEVRQAKPYLYHARRVGDGLYHLRLRLWKNYFWKIDTARLGAWRVRGAAAVFGKPGGDEAPLPVTMASSSIPLSLAILRTALKAEERRKLQEIARLIILRQPLEDIKRLSAEFIRQCPDVDSESAVREITDEIKRDPALAKKIEESETLLEKLKEFEAAFEDFDRKTNQLTNILSAVLKTMKDTQAAVARDMS